MDADLGSVLHDHQDPPAHRGRRVQREPHQHPALTDGDHWDRDRLADRQAVGYAVMSTRRQVCVRQRAGRRTDDHLPVLECVRSVGAESSDQSTNGAEVGLVCRYWKPEVRLWLAGWGLLLAS